MVSLSWILLHTLLYSINTQRWREIQVPPFYLLLFAFLVVLHGMWDLTSLTRNWNCIPCFPGGTSSKETPANSGDLRDSGLIPGWGRAPGGGHGNPLQYSCLEKPMDRGALWATVYGVAKSQTWLSDLVAAAACALEGRSLTTGPPGKSQLPPIYSCSTDRKVE